MESVFRLSATWASIIRLFTPLVKGDTNTAVLRGMLCDPLASGNLKGTHGVTTGSEVHLNETGWVESAVGLDGVCGGPVLDGMVVFQEWVQSLVMGRREFTPAVPERPAFMSNRECWCNRVDAVGDHDVPVALGEVVHFFI